MEQHHAVSHCAHPGLAEYTVRGLVGALDSGQFRLTHEHFSVLALVASSDGARYYYTLRACMTLLPRYVALSDRIKYTPLAYVARLLVASSEDVINFLLGTHSMACLSC